MPTEGLHAFFSGMSDADLRHALERHFEDTLHRPKWEWTKLEQDRHITLWSVLRERHRKRAKAIWLEVVYQVKGRIR